MCLNCGCNEPDERHGDKRNLTMRDLMGAAKANDAEVRDQLKNISATAKKVLEGSLKSTAWKPPTQKAAQRSAQTGTRKKSK